MLRDATLIIIAIILAATLGTLTDIRASLDCGLGYINACEKVQERYADSKSEEL